MVCPDDELDVAVVCVVVAGLAGPVDDELVDGPVDDELVDGPVPLP